MINCFFYDETPEQNRKMWGYSPQGVWSEEYSIPPRIGECVIHNKLWMRIINVGWNSPDTVSFVVHFSGGVD